MTEKTIDPMENRVEVAPAYDPLGSITALAGATIAADILYLNSEALDNL